MDAQLSSPRISLSESESQTSFDAHGLRAAKRAPPAALVSKRLGLRALLSVWTLAGSGAAARPREGSGDRSALVDSAYSIVRSPLLAEIIGGLRAWTVSMISALSIPCR